MLEIVIDTITNKLCSQPKTEGKKPKGESVKYLENSWAIYGCEQLYQSGLQVKALEFKASGLKDLNKRTISKAIIEALKNGSNLYLITSKSKNILNDYISDQPLVVKTLRIWNRKDQGYRIEVEDNVVCVIAEKSDFWPSASGVDIIYNDIAWHNELRDKPVIFKPQVSNNHNYSDENYWHLVRIDNEGNLDCLRVMEAGENREKAIRMAKAIFEIQHDFEGKTLKAESETEEKNMSNQHGTRVLDEPKKYKTVTASKHRVFVDLDLAEIRRLNVIVSQKQLSTEGTEKISRARVIKEMILWAMEQIEKESKT